MRSRFWILVAGVVVAAVAVGFFVTRFLNPTPDQITATSTSATNTAPEALIASAPSFEKERRSARTFFLTSSSRPGS